MAKARMVAKTISIDKELNNLSLKSQLIYTWCIPFLDDFGLITNDIGDLKYLVFPRNLHVTEEDIKTSFEEMKNQQKGLIVELSDCFYFKGFEKHNTITSYKRVKSQFKQNRYNKPKTDDSPEIPEISQENPDEDKVSKGKLIEDKLIKDIYKDFSFFEDKDFKILYNDYLKMRKKKRASPTELAETLVLKELHKYSPEDAKTMLEKSIKSSWTDVYPLKDNKKPLIVIQE